MAHLVWGRHVLGESDKGLSCSGNNTFTGISSSDWSDASNWTSGCVPTGIITGHIKINANCINNNADNYIFSAESTLEIVFGVTFTNNGSGNWYMQGTVINNGNYIQQVFNNQGIHGGSGVFTGSFHNQGGLLKSTILQPVIPSWTCGDPLLYEGQSYPTVQIGGQCWMAKNLNVGSMITTGQTNNGIIEKHCYNNNINNCNIYGGLYQWNEMMQYTTLEEAQGICPEGWHVPSDLEWSTLEEEVETSTGTFWNTTGYRGTDVGLHLRETGAAHWFYPNSNATNSSGFTGLPGGNANGSGFYFNISLYGFYYTSTENGTKAWSRYLYVNESRTARYDNQKANSISVRCVKD